MTSGMDDTNIIPASTDPMDRIRALEGRTGYGNEIRLQALEIALNAIVKGDPRPLQLAGLALKVGAEYQETDPDSVKPKGRRLSAVLQAVYTTREGRDGTERSITIGTATTNRDGSTTIRLDALPMAGSLTIAAGE